MVEQIQREITIMRHLSHPNIVNLKEVMSSKDKIYMVMELVTGGELFDRIATEGPMKVARFWVMNTATQWSRNGQAQEHSARRIFCELLDGLHYCHSQGVYHRYDRLMCIGCSTIALECVHGISATSPQRIKFIASKSIPSIVIVSSSPLLKMIFTNSHTNHTKPLLHQRSQARKRFACGRRHRQAL